MNIIEAAEILDDYQDLCLRLDNPHLKTSREAMTLGVEALRRLQRCREEKSEAALIPLPSEGRNEW